MVYKNVKIFVDENEYIENGFIFFEDGIIKKVGDMKDFKKQYEEKGFEDLKGYKIYPGFVEAHNHIGMWESGLCFEGADGNEETDPITPNFRAIDAVNPKDEAFSLALEAGVTTVITGPGSANPIAGSFVALKTYGDCIDEMVIKNPVGIKFALGENPKTTYNEKDMTPMTRMGIAALIREQLEKAKRYKEKLNDEDKPEYDAKCEALIPLLERKIKAFFHCHRADDIFTAIRIAKEFNLDLTLVHATEGYLIAKYLKNVDIISGPIISDLSKPEVKQASEKNPFILYENKAIVSICTDAPVFPIQYLNLCCAVAVRNGLEKEKAILSITKNSAKVCGIFDKVGSIEKDKVANFAIFKMEEDIFSVYVRPSFVVVDGEIVYKK